MRQRSELLWNARQTENWAAAYDCQDPEELGAATSAEFVAWCEKNEPFRVHSFTIGEIVVDGDLGWVAVKCRTSMRRFPTAPPVEADRWEVWRRVAGKWCVAPSTKRDAYPTSPALRDADAELALRQRMVECWNAKLVRDWAGAYAFSDPRDRDTVPESTFARGHGQLDYLSYDVQWVEVIKGRDRGKVRVAFQLKLADPSLTKMQPQERTITEDWVKVDGQWCLELVKGKSAAAQEVPGA